MMNARELMVDMEEKLLVDLQELCIFHYRQFCCMIYHIAGMFGRGS